MEIDKGRFGALFRGRYSMTDAIEGYQAILSVKLLLRQLTLNYL